MYVDVIACKRSRVKVDITLAKRRANTAVPAAVRVPVKNSVSIPVKVVALAVEEPVQEAEVQNASAENEIFEEIIETVQQETEQPDEEDDSDEIVTMSELLDMTGEDELSFSAGLTGCEECPADESLAAIEEMLGEADDAVTEEQFEELVSDALGELNDMSRRTDSIRERLDGQLAEALEELDGAAAEDSEELSSVIGKELESLDNVLSQRGESEKNEQTASDNVCGDEQMHSAETSYMRYFDRDEQGGRVEVSSDTAIGQEVVCYNEQSGKLSRVCGIIKNNSARNDSDEK